MVEWLTRAAVPRLAPVAPRSVLCDGALPRCAPGAPGRRAAHHAPRPMPSGHAAGWQPPRSPWACGWQSRSGLLARRARPAVRLGRYAGAAPSPQPPAARPLVAPVRPDRPAADVREKRWRRCGARPPNGATAVALPAAAEDGAEARRRRDVPRSAAAVIALPSRP